MSDFRPISLYRVIQKLVAEALANTLKRCLPCIINEAESGFVLGKLITDNVIIAFEAFHQLQQTRRGEKKFMAIKLDMSKAYDRVNAIF